jgi:hypothetical protein
MELREWEVLDSDANATPSPQVVLAGMETRDEAEDVGSKDMPNRDSNFQATGPLSRINADTFHQPLDLGEGSSRRPPAIAKNRNDIVPAAIGRETCPICIMDFEEGDDLRLLPCEGKHRFHQTCVDPWLLELSSSCPICREGKMMASPSI